VEHTGEICVNYAVQTYILHKITLLSHFLTESLSNSRKHRLEQNKTSVIIIERIKHKIFSAEFSPRTLTDPLMYK